jgi:GTP cyclohydrolase I
MAKSDTHAQFNGNVDHQDGDGLADQAGDVMLVVETEMDAQLSDPALLAKYELNYAPVNIDAIKTAVTKILEAVGEDPQREGLLNTPKRVAGAYEELLSGYRMDPTELVNNAVFNVDYDDMIIVRDIEYFSLCEHHMLPFFGHAHVAYIPSHKVIGLSKIPRVVDMFSRRLQVQEKLARQIAFFIEEVLEAKGVAVLMDGIHMCSMMRGVEKVHSGMSTATWLGQFKNNRELRKEFMAHIERAGGKKTFG